MARRDAVLTLVSDDAPVIWMVVEGSVVLSTGGGVDGVAEDVAVILQHRAVVDSDLDLHLVRGEFLAHADRSPDGLFG